MNYEKTFEELYKKYDGRYGDLVGKMVDALDCIETINTALDEKQNLTEQEQSFLEWTQQLREKIWGK